MSFLPVCREDLKKRGWDSIDFLYISGDAYVDHPSFGHAIITRVLEKMGFKVGIIPQPDWKNLDSFKALGRPKLACLIGSGVIDSMVNHYTAAKKRRSEDLYSPGGKSGMRPDRALIVYGNKIRECFPGLPVIIGGIEASLRRFAHYDYWDDRVRDSILTDCFSDLLIYGMGEGPIEEIAQRLKNGEDIKDMQDVRGTAFLRHIDDLSHEHKKNIEASKREGNLKKCVFCPDAEEVKSDKNKYARAFLLQYREQDPYRGKIVYQKSKNMMIVQNLPPMPLSEKEMDKVYALPYERTYHPMYEKDGGIPAIKEVEFSITSHRGCFGGCSFCALHFHQGRIIQKRSEQSIVEEVKKLTWLPEFKGYIHDVGGPTANFRERSCKKQETDGMCKDRQCLFPKPCKNLIVDHSSYLSLLRKVKRVDKVKKVFIRSGIRFDYLVYDRDTEFFEELCRDHVSGQLKVAPEHVSPKVLKYMGKPGNEVYEKFTDMYHEICKKHNKEQYLVPYLISGHPGSDLSDAIELALYLKKIKYSPEQVQDFYPTPGSLSTCMYYTGKNPLTGEAVHVAKDPEEKAMQRALLQFRKPENKRLVLKALKKAGREDLIGNGRDCLISDFKNRNIRK